MSDRVANQQQMIAAGLLMPSPLGVDPWQAAQEVVDALVAAGLLGRDPVTRAEVVVVVESEVRRILGVGT